MENAVPVRLQHLGMRVKARIALLSDLLRQQLDSICRVAKDDGLVDLKLKLITMFSRHRCLGSVVGLTLPKRVLRQWTF